MALIVDVETPEKREGFRRIARNMVILCSYLQCQMFEERNFAAEYILLLFRKGKRTALPKLTSKNCWSKDVT